MSSKHRQESGKFYEHCDGVAMGSPLRPTLTNVFMCHFENIWLVNCPPPHFEPIVYARVGRGAKTPPYQFFPCNFYKRKS